VISFTEAQWTATIAAFLWPLTRVLGLIAAAPVLGSAMVPARVKLGLGVAVTFIIAPSLDLPAIAPWSAEGFATLALQFAIGTAIGFVMRLTFTAIEFAGELMGLQTGLGFATFFDPQSTASVQVIAQFLGLLATLVFLALNGHLVLLTVLMRSFDVLPVGAWPVSASVLQVLVGAGAHVFFGGFMLALPVVATLLVVNLALGVLTRASPQLNLFSVGFPLTLLIGFSAMFLVLPHLGNAMIGMMEQGLGLADQLFAPPR